MLGQYLLCPNLPGGLSSNLGWKSAQIPAVTFSPMAGSLCCCQQMQQLDLQLPGVLFVLNPQQFLNKASFHLAQMLSHHWADGWTELDQKAANQWGRVRQKIQNKHPWSHVAAARDPLCEDRAELILTQDQLSGLCLMLSQHREGGTFPSSASLLNVRGSQFL